MIDCDCLLIVEGPAAARAAFFDRHLADHDFSFESIVPMPSELDFSVCSTVESGHAALFGDWREPARQWMFKDHAAEQGWPFPLESREHVLACMAALGEFGEELLRLGRLFQSNLDRFGHGNRDSWTREQWGTDIDAYDSVVEAGEDALRIAFRTSGAPAAKLLARCSSEHPELTLTLVSFAESGKHAKQQRFAAGRALKLPPIGAADATEQVLGFRRRASPASLAAWLGVPAAMTELELNERGSPMLTGTTVGLYFALTRLCEGEAPEELARRFPAMTAAHVELLRAAAPRAVQRRL